MNAVSSQKYLQNQLPFTVFLLTDKFKWLVQDAFSFNAYLKTLKEETLVVVFYSQYVWNADTSYNDTTASNFVVVVVAELILDELYPPEPEAEDQGMDSS